MSKIHPAFSLGMFDLFAPLGRGGMGAVWRGEHRTQRIPVAVKVLNHDLYQDPLYISAFQAEAQAAASLHHPHIIALFDEGVIPTEAEKASAGKLCAGSPYLVMELAQGGSLKEHGPPQQFAQVREILLALLDALAHAHARGVLHRDIKPSNLLFSNTDNLLKLTDFGIAHARDFHQEEPHPFVLYSGTPAYMAPEQILGQWRKEGPWTDLYAVGQLAYWLVSGHTAFKRRRTPRKELLRKHLHEKPPPLRTNIPVPEGFGRWCARLLEKRQGQRFQRAADAAMALLSLPTSKPNTAKGRKHTTLVDASFTVPTSDQTQNVGPPITDPLQEDTEQSTQPTPVSGLEQAEDAEEFLPLPAVQKTMLALKPMLRAFTQDDEPPEETEHIAPSQHKAGFESAAKTLPQAPTRKQTHTYNTPPPPETWKRPNPPPTPPTLHGVGLRLFGLRSVPLIGRERQRDQIWTALREVWYQGSTRLLLLQGPAGVGKSRLAEWITQRGHETGAVTVLRATHGPRVNPAHGIPRMLARHMMCSGLSHQNTLNHIKQWSTEHTTDPWDEYQSSALTALILPEHSEEHGAHTQEKLQAPTNKPPSRDATRPLRPFGGRTEFCFSNPQERYRALTNFLQALCTQRPVMIWLDDIQWGSDTLSWLQFLLQNKETLPVLFLLTLRDELLPQRPVEAGQLESIMQHPQAQTLSLLALQSDERRALIQQLLSLDAHLARQVETRTDGNPLFAVQLIKDWIQRGILESTNKGFRLREGVEAYIPDDIYALWLERIELLIQSTIPPNHDKQTLWTTLKLAAAFGQDLEQHEWKTGCTLAKTPFPTPFILAMSRQQLLRPTEQGWAFVHGMLAEALARKAREDGDWKELHRICAMTIARCYHDSVALVQERQSQHLLEAEAFQEALTPLQEAIHYRFKNNDFALALQLCQQYEDALLAFNAPRTHLGWAHLSLERATIFLELGHHTDTQQALEHADNLIQPLAQDALHGRLFHLRGALHFRNGRVKEAQTSYQRSLEHLERCDDLPALLDCQMSYARTFASIGQIERACTLLADLRERCRQLQLHRRLALCTGRLSSVCLALGQVERAHQLNQEAYHYFRSHGMRFHLAVSLNDAGEIARTRGKFQESIRFYRESARILEMLLASHALIPRVNLTILEITQGHFTQAYEHLKPIETQLSQNNYLSPLGYVHTGALACLADAQDWPAWDQRLQKLLDWQTQCPQLEKDYALLAEIAGDLCRKHHQPERAKAIYSFALTQYEGLLQHDNAQRIATHLASLP